MIFKGGWGVAAGAALIAVAGMAAAQQPWWRDPFKTGSMVSPAPDRKWEPDGPLPAVAVPQSPEGLAGDKALSLPELTEFALQNNPRTRQAWYAARAAAAGFGFAQAGDFPIITGGVGFLRSRPVSGTTGIAAPWLSRYGPSISLSHVLYDFGSGDGVTEAAEYRLLAANLAQNRVLQEVMFQVEQAYYLLIGTEAIARVNEQSLKNSETALDAAKRRRDSGVATIADVYRAETQVAQARLVLTRTRGEFEKARGQLATVVGLPVNSSLRVLSLSGPPQVQQTVTAISAHLDRVKQMRPDLVAAEAQVRAARAAADAASKAGRPSIELTASSGINEYTSNWHPDRPSARPHSLFVNLKIPIFSGFRETYAARQAQALADQAEAQRDVLYRQAQLEVWQAYQDLQTVTSGISSTEAQVRFSEQTAQATLARYRAGFGTLLDLITAQQDEANARTQRIQSYLDWYTVLARLNYALGASEPQSARAEKKQ